MVAMLMLTLLPMPERIQSAWYADCLASWCGPQDANEMAIRVEERLGFTEKTKGPH
jgi:hypothetical protein